MAIIYLPAKTATGADTTVALDISGGGTTTDPGRGRVEVTSGSITAAIAGQPTVVLAASSEALYAGTSFTSTRKVTTTSTAATAPVAITSGTGATSYLQIVELVVSVATATTVTIQTETGTAIITVHLAANVPWTFAPVSENWRSPDQGDELEIVTGADVSTRVNITTRERGTIT